MFFKTPSQSCHAQGFDNQLLVSPATAVWGPVPRQTQSYPARPTISLPNWGVKPAPVWSRADYQLIISSSQTALEPVWVPYVNLDGYSLQAAECWVAGPVVFLTCHCRGSSRFWLCHYNYGKWKWYDWDPIPDPDYILCHVCVHCRRHDCWDWRSNLIAPKNEYIPAA